MEAEADYSNFNPRTHTGCDKRIFAGNVGRPAISIHAPTRGATKLADPDAFGAEHFNPRTHTGCDGLFFIDGDTHQWTFQSTHPHGVRLISLSPFFFAPLFQSTHPHGVRRPSMVSFIGSSGFQSTHPHGVRQAPLVRVYRVAEHFNPRTHTGCDSKNT